MALKQGVISPAPTDKIDTAEYTFILLFALGVNISRIQNNNIIPQPVNTKFFSPNFFTNDLIKKPCTIIEITPTTTKVSLEASVVQFNDSCRKNIRILVKPVNAKKYIKKASERYLVSIKISFVVSVVFGLVSSRKKNTKIKLIIGIIDAIITGIIKLLLVFLAKITTKILPKKKLKPKATPIRPNAAALSFLLEISAKIVVAIAVVPPVNPSINRAKNNKNKGIVASEVLQSNNTVNDSIDLPIIEPAMQYKITIRLPNLSAKNPMRNNEQNCAIWYVIDKKA